MDICPYAPQFAKDKATKLEEIPEDWTCPACGVGKDHFEKVI